MSRKKTQGQEDTGKKAVASGDDKAADNGKRSGNGSWQKIEALREKAALKASLADVWDEDFDLDEQTLADLDHTAEYFTTEADDTEEIPGDDADDIDEFYDEEEV